MTFYERISEKPSDTFEDILLEDKGKRVSSSKGNIVLLYDGELEDSVLTAINVARELWESKLKTSVPIYMYVVFEPLDNDIAMAAEVSYWDYESSELYGLPTSLVSQIKGISDNSAYNPDFIIILNSELNWNCIFNKPNDHSCNITTMIMRGIARGLGFGSSIRDFGNGLEYYFGYPSIFDKLLFNENYHLTDFSQNSKEMLDFAQSGTVKFKTENNIYKIYSPNKYIQDASLCYLENGNSLMSYNMGNGNIALSVDNATIDILNSIGWSIPESNVKIICNDISNDGIGSSYIEHTFSIGGLDIIPTSYSWEFSLKQKDGKYITVSIGNEKEFTIEKITNSKEFYINTNGDFEGRIDCKYEIDGAVYSLPTFSVSLEQKPIILSVSDIIKTEKDFKLQLEFNVNYRGADRIMVETEEDFNSSVRTTRYDEPFIAHVKTGQMTSLYYSWVTIVVTNKYGNTYYTIENEPMYSREADVINLTSVSTNNYIIHVYDLFGHEIYTGAQASFHKQNLDKGIYIVKEYSVNGNPIIYKISR